MKFRLAVSRWLIVGLALFAAFGSPAGGEPLPVVLVTLSSVDTLIERVDHVAQLMGFANAPQVQVVRDGINGFARGLDRQRPVAILLQADETSYQVFAMVPLVNLATWLQALPAMGSNVTDIGNGTFQVQVGPQTLVLTADENWAYLTQSADALPLRPSEPVEVLQGLNEQYDLAVRFIVQNIPVGPREFALNQYRQLMQMAMSRTAEANSPNAEFQRANLERQFAEVQRFADEADLITFGLSITPSRQSMIGEFSMTAVAGSRLDRRMAVTEKAVTHHSGFYFPKATATASLSHPLLPEDGADQAQQLDAMLRLAKSAIAGDQFPGNDAAKQELNDVVDELGEIAKESLSGGMVDSAVTLVTGTEQLNVIAATRLAGGDRWEALLKKMQRICEEMEIPAEFRLGFSQQDDVNFHAARFTLPESKELSRAFGDRLTVYLGVSADTVYLGIGDKSLSGLRKAILASRGTPQPVPPFRGSLSVGSLVAYVAHVMDRADIEAAANAFGNAGENGRIRVSQQRDRRGSLVTRLEVQDGVLTSLGRVIQEQMESP